MKQHVNYHHAQARHRTSFRQTTIAERWRAEASMYVKPSRHGGKGPGPGCEHVKRNTYNGTTFEHNRACKTIERFLNICHYAAKGHPGFICQLDGPEQLGPNLARIAVWSAPEQPYRQNWVQSTNSIPSMNRTPAAVQQPQHRNGAEVQGMARAFSFGKATYFTSNHLRRPTSSSFCMTIHGDKILKSS